MKSIALVALVALVNACAPAQEYLIHPDTLAPHRTAAPAVRLPTGERVTIDPRALDRKTAVQRSDGTVAIRAKSKNAHLISGGIVLGIGAVLSIVGLSLTTQPCTGYSDFRCLGRDVNAWAPASTGFGAMLAGTIILGTSVTVGNAERSDQRMVPD
jgi:hypothetical protein